MLGKYGVILKRNLKELYPIRYSELTIKTTLIEKLLEREKEIIKQKDIIIKQLKEKNPEAKTKEYIIMAKYDQVIESMAEELLQPMLKEKI